MVGFVPNTRDTRVKKKLWSCTHRRGVHSNGGRPGGKCEHSSNYRDVMEKIKQGNERESS